jgi:hypothetical protein
MFRADASIVRPNFMQNTVNFTSLLQIIVIFFHINAEKMFAVKSRRLQKNTVMMKTATEIIIAYIRYLKL